MPLRTTMSHQLSARINWRRHKLGFTTARADAGGDRAHNNRRKKSHLLHVGSWRSKVPRAWIRDPRAMRFQLKS